MATNVLLRNQLSSEEPSVRDAMFPQLRRDRVHTFIDSFTGPVITGSTTLEVDGSLSLTLSSLADSSSYAAFYDAYRFVSVKMTFMPTTSAAEGSASAPIYTAIDHDDTNTTSISQLVQYDSIKVCPPSQYFERTFTPKIAVRYTRVHSHLFRRKR